MKLAILVTAAAAEGLPRTCHDIFLKEAKKCKLADNGFYDIKPRHWLPKRKVEERKIVLPSLISKKKVIFRIKCIFDTQQGWTVVQNRYNGEEDFNRKYEEYRRGFGCLKAMSGSEEKDCKDEYWIGLEYMYWIQRSHNTKGSKICAFIQKGASPHEYVCYDKFQFDNSKSNYKILHIEGWNNYMTKLPNAFRGGNGKNKHKNDLLGAKFSAPDRDNDKSSTNCALAQKSGWWFNDCTNVNLNGEWKPKSGKGAFWYHPKRSYNRLDKTKMFISPAQDNYYACLENQDE